MLSFILSILLVLGLSPVFSQAVFLDNIVRLDPYQNGRNFPYSLGPKLTSQSALALDVETGEVLFEKNPTVVLPVASITKLMTALVFWENNTRALSDKVKVEQGDLVIETNIESDLEPAGLVIKPEDSLSIEDIFYGSLVKSANNAAKILARLIESDTNEAFVDLMNKKAEVLGMTDTHFVEPTGLDSKNCSTASDLAKLIIEAVKNDNIKRALNTKTYDVSILRPGSGKIYQRVYNTNKLLGGFIDLIGAKTGYLRESGYCFAGLSDYQGYRTAVVVLGAATDQDRFQEVKGLIWWTSSLEHGKIGTLEY